MLIRNLVLALGLAFTAASHALPPANDLFANAEVIPSQTSATVTGTTVEATTETGDPDRDFDSGNDCSVWFRWTAPQSGIVTMDAVTNGVLFHDAVVFIGDSLQSGKFIEGRRITSNPLLFYALAGQTYRFCIYNDDNQTASFTLNLAYESALPAKTKYVAPLANDDYANPYQFGAFGGQAVFYGLDATQEPFEEQMLDDLGIGRFGNGHGGVWATWQAPISGTVKLEGLNPFERPAVLIVGQGNSLNDFRANVIVQELSTLEFRATARETYRIYVLAADPPFTHARYPQVLARLYYKNGTRGLFAGVSGTFNTLIGDNGFLSVGVTKDGRFIGKITINGVAYSIKGQFDSSGHFTGVLPRTNIPFSLDIDLSAPTNNPGAIVIDGSVGDGVAAQSFTARHTFYNRSAPLTEAGKYTLVLGSTTTGNTAPAGSGYMRMTIGKTGSVTITGKLADGTPFTTSGPLVGDGSGGAQLNVYNTRIYANRGRLSGAIDFATAPGSDCTATLDWVKPVRSRDKYYDLGFATELDLKGARYVAPVRAVALPFPPGPVNFAAEQGSLTNPLIESVVLSPVNKITVTGANPQKLKVTFVPATGGFLGSFTHPVSGKTVKFEGVLYQNTTTPKAEGFFYGPLTSGHGLTGKVLIAP